MSTREPVTPARDSAARATRGGEATPAKELEQLKRQIAETSAAAEAIATDLRATLAIGRDDACIDRLRRQRRELRVRIIRLQARVPHLEQARRRAEQASQVPIAESLTSRAREAEQRRMEALRELHRGILHAFAKLGALERAQREVELSREEAAAAWRRAGLDAHEANQRVGVARNPPLDALGGNARLWMSSWLRNLRAARADFTAWWKL